MVPAFEGRWSAHAVRLRLPSEKASIQISLPKGISAAEETSATLRYLSLDKPSQGELDCLPWRSDPVLDQALAAFPGLRILAQPFGETLFCFLCSATKRIDQIKVICEKVAHAHGAPLTNGSYALPSWETLASVGEQELRECQLGYRAKYIANCARFLAEHPGWLERVSAMPTAEARIALQQLPGVGEKIADCTLLFGAGRLEVFPIDTWIQQAMENLYGLRGWGKAQLQTFAKAHFGSQAGYAQQVLFAHVRSKQNARAAAARKNP